MEFSTCRSREFSFSFRWQPGVAVMGVPFSFCFAFIVVDPWMAAAEDEEEEKELVEAHHYSRHFHIERT
jgi:hypothetical protein